MDIRLRGLLGASVFALMTTPAVAQEVASSSTLGEIVVTATRRADSIQNVPIAVQAVDGQTIKALNIQNFADYVATLPNVNFGGRGPGQNDIYIRGMASSKVGVQLSGAQGTQPNVALYLDDQPVSLTGRNLDVYVTDMERIEVLSGPQGTLFGASSQAGTVRLITNKPKLGVYEASATGGVAYTKHGAMSNSFEGAVNLPLMGDKLAVRLVGYSVQMGGYIDNVQGRQTLSPSNPFFPTGATLAFADNTAFVKNNFNDSSYAGFRVGAKYQVNDDWSLLLQHSEQTLTSDGVFDYDPAVGDLEVHRYYPDNLEDKYQQTSWTVEGRIAALNVIYTGGFIKRHIVQHMDYTGYGNIGPFIPYYVCNYPAYTHCGNPTLGAINHVNVHRLNQEVRVSTPAEWRFRFTAGAYYDSGEDQDRGDFDYPQSIAEGFALNRPLVGSTASDPSFRGPGIVFINDYTHKDHQLSFFGEASFDILPTLTITGGLRRYHLAYQLKGSTAFGNRGPTDLGFGVNVDQRLAGKSPATEDGVVPRVSLTWKPAKKLLFYATYSEGFRPGGFNRGGGEGNALGTVPFTYRTDKVKNYEAGWKTTLFDNTLRWNGTVYFMKWSDMQVTAFRPAISHLFFTDNAADAEIKGVESDFSFAPTDHVSINGAFSFNDTKLTRVAPGITNVAPVGSSLAQAPRVQANLRPRYSWDMGDYSLYVEGALQYSSKSYSSLQIDERFPQRAYTIINLSAGVRKDQWSALFYLDNITDKRADLYVNTQDHTQRITTNRPFTAGMKVSYDFK